MLTEDDKEEINKLKNKLLFKEKVESVAKTSSYTHNGSVIPYVIFATTHRIMEKKCYPLKPKFFFYEYDKIISTELKKGILKSHIMLVLPGEECYFYALDKDKATYMIDVINNHVKQYNFREKDKDLQIALAHQLENIFQRKQKKRS